MRKHALNIFIFSSIFCFLLQGQIFARNGRTPGGPMGGMSGLAPDGGMLPSGGMDPRGERSRRGGRDAETVNVTTAIEEMLDVFSTGRKSNNRNNCI